MPLPVIVAYGIFFFALGACVGSFLNVVIWRLPNRGREILYQQKRGRLTLSWPPSHCPVCDSPIRWYQNIPILSWIFLRAKCANCQTSIPVRYPLVELGTACAFFALYLAYFVAHWQPGFTDLGHDWPAYVLHVIMIACLLAASAIDADLFIIPLSIPWLLLAIALCVNPFINQPVIPTVDPTGAVGRLTLGATAGLAISLLLLWLKILPRSFSEQFFAQQAAQAAAISVTPAAADGTTPAVPGAETENAPAPPVSPPEPPPSTATPMDAPAAAAVEPPMAPPPKLTRFGISLLATAILLLAAILSWIFLSALAASLISLCVAIVIFLLGVLPRDAGQTDVTDEVMEEISAAYVRAEVAKEGLFIFIPLACAIAAIYLPIHLPNAPHLGRLLGTLLGALTGGGIIWFIRVAGTMAFNREAMGRGDVDLLMAIGAVMGAPLVIITFFTAPFIALLWALVLKILGKPNVLPYGPWLSIAAIINLLVGNAFIVFYLNAVNPAPDLAGLLPALHPPPFPLQFFTDV
jgi:prepilin signal peptidase PulO-like enzyme (type II secretory pathway)